ncbi:MAG: PadR family transcriptional regulator [Clostridiales bacterium]|jgi:DNA-binding PadR family transcriptional regulator|nr:PadR family transcriptional regulator [Clostridiales bacterium]
MSINHAILGILSWKPATGYELKKIFVESSIMYWSGNNNQIYKSLSHLLNEGLVGSEVVHQDGSPSKKIYTITDAGVKSLKEWVSSTPELPEIKNTFLVQFAWADLLSDQELNDLILSYEIELKAHLIMEKEIARRTLHNPDRNPREKAIWELISENIVSSYDQELKWVQEVRRRLLEDNNNGRKIYELPN